MDEARGRGISEKGRSLGKGTEPFINTALGEPHGVLCGWRKGDLWQRVGR